MRKKTEETIKIPEDVVCKYIDKTLFCKKESIELARNVYIPNVKITVEGKSIKFLSDSANKKEIKKIKSYIAHIKNILKGLEQPYVYKLEAVNVHFPMGLKKEAENIMITNFLGETISRKAKIIKNVEVDIKGSSLIVSSPDKEAAGQVAANLEQATKVKGRDPRIFQDGIYIVEKPGDKK